MTFRWLFRCLYLVHFRNHQQVLLWNWLPTEEDGAARRKWKSCYGMQADRNWSPRKQRWTPNSKSNWFRERSSCNRIFFWISMKFHLSLRGCSYKMDSTTAGCISWGATGKRVQKWRSGRTAQLSLLHLHNKVSGIIWRNQCRTKSQLRSAFWGLSSNFSA